jgi:6-phosphofructokinase 1
MTKSFAVITSGGDAPGMNSALRSIVRSGIAAGYNVYGYYRGYQGIFAGEYEQMTSFSVSGLLSRGGSALGCARSAEMLEPDGPEKCAAMLKEHGMDALLAIGGDGTFRGLAALQNFGVKVIGLPGTIDNDIPGLDRTIGFDTACDTLAWCINRLRDTAESHHRTFVVEAMGRHAGWLALHGGMAGGADVILIPEIPWTPEEVVARLTQRSEEGRIFHLVVLAEGAGRATDLTDYIQKQMPPEFEVRACIPGHIQRGGVPTTVDRILGARAGYYAVQALSEGRSGIVVGQLLGQIVEVPLKHATSGSRKIDLALYELALTIA